MLVIIMTIIIMTIIQRCELDKVLNSSGYSSTGGRKTGKTFYIREKARYNKYFIVTETDLLSTLKG